MQKVFSLSVLAYFLSDFPYNHASSGNYFTFGVHMIPHPKKAYKGGEDAYYADKGLLAVADGVGGWAESGIDPGLYSKELCLNISKLWSQKSFFYQKSPKKLIIDASGLSTQIGSSTCCVLAIDPGVKLLRSAYIGDSGYLLYRKQQIGNAFEQIYASPDHQRSFNFPYQIGTNGDDPSISLEKTHEVQEGDLIIVGTDGLLDNLSQEEMKEIVNKKGQIELNSLAKEMAEKAFENSMNKKKVSPFQIKARESGLLYFGGKPDDITVIAAIINTN